MSNTCNETYVFHFYVVHRASTSYHIITSMLGTKYKRNMQRRMYNAND